MTEDSEFKKLYKEGIELTIKEDRPDLLKRLIETLHAIIDKPRTK